MVVFLQKLQLALRKIGERHTIFFFEKGLIDPSINIEAKVPVRLRLLEKQDLPEILSIFPHLSATEVRNRWKMGHIGLGAETSGKLVSMRWVSFNESYIGKLARNLHLDSGSDSAYLYDEYTIPEHRGLGISPTSFIMALNYLKTTTKVKRVFVAIAHNNISSLNAAQKEKLKKIGTVTYFRVLKWSLYKLSGTTDSDLKKIKVMFSM